MALQVIGSGLGRTGTKSLHAALNLLGLGPCHHMMEVFQNPETMPLWIEAGAGRPDWESVFDGYRSAVDYPTAAYWRELALRYPEAKIIHTIRDPADWFESTQATIFRPGGIAHAAIQSSELIGDFFRSFIKPPLLDHLNDRDWLLDYFRRHTDEVKATIPPDRLLFYEVTEGWAPLCAFLGLDVPGEAFPSQNSRAEFIARAASTQR